MVATDLAQEALEMLESAREIHTEEEVSAALDRMAREITELVEKDDPVVLAIMRGGVFAATEICRRLSFPFRFDYVHATRYADDLTGGALKWRVRPSPELANRTVVIVDDILDRGETLDALLEELRDLRVKAVYSAVLISKTMPESVLRPSVDSIGLEVEDVYVFGCGMDYKGYWRGQRSLYAVAGD